MSKQSILEFFHEHLDEQDWYEGIDLYQAGKVSKIQNYEGLLCANVNAGLGGERADVRLKIHPNGSTIQWIECTCRKNRMSGRYCEHMSAFMFGIEREKPELLKNLDSKMPFRPPATTRKPRNSGGAQERKPLVPLQDEGMAPSQKILSHLEGSIHSAGYVNQGTTLRVRLELKPGQLMNYNLDIDGAARYLQSNPKLKKFGEELADIKIHDALVQRGTLLTQAEDETIVADRVVAIRHTERSAQAVRERGGHPETVFREVTLFSAEHPKGKAGLYELVPIKHCQKYLGKEFFFIPSRGYWPLSKDDVRSEWHDTPQRKIYHDDDAANLVGQNFQEALGLGPIWLDEKLKQPIVVNNISLDVIKVVSEGDGWFYLDPKYAFGEHNVSMIEMLEQARKKKRAYVKTGRAWIKIPDFIKENTWDTDESGKFIKVDTIGLMRIRAALGDFDHFVGSKKALTTLRNRTEFHHDIEEPSLAHSRLNLREYQQTGFKWLWWLYKNNLHGLLADEMGLGKTHQTMALLQGILEEKKGKGAFLIIAPTTVLDHWEDKLQAFCPDLKPLKHHGPKRNRNFSAIGRHHHAMITSYGILLRDIKEVSAVHWDAVILDEAHFVKNNDTATYHAVCRLQAGIRVCLTGTPIENHLGELKNIFDFLVPGYLGSDEFFRKNFMTPLQTNEAPEREMALQKLIHPFKLRRTKDNVLKDLPAKVEDIRHCNLSDEQAGLYKNILAMKASPLIQQLKDENSPIPYLHVFATINLLKQVCDHPALILDTPDYKNHNSGKFEALKELLEEALGSGHKVVIFSQYVSMIAIIDRYLSDNDVGHVVLTGQTKNRGKVISQFQEDPHYRVFCGSLLAGGIGIDLTAASVVIHYDRWWNASKENQATDRIHRIGQNKNVQVFKLLTKGTLEEKIDQLITAKRLLFEKFIDRDEEIFKTFSREQLIDLLQ